MAVTAYKSKAPWEEPVKKKQKNVESIDSLEANWEPKPEDLVPGTAVFYWEDRVGIVKEAFAPLDQFWLLDEDTGNVVTGEDNKIQTFAASELYFVSPLPVSRPRYPKQGWGPLAGVLVLGTEEHMTEALNLFGLPSDREANDPQMLLALPNQMCTDEALATVGLEGVPDNVAKFGRKLREDIQVSVRSFHLRQALGALGDFFLRMDGYYILSGVQLPYSWGEIEKEKGWMRTWREEICNQIDVSVTALASNWPEEKTVADAAKRALGEKCGIMVSDVIWTEDAQRKIRKSLHMGDLPLHFTDANQHDITVLVLPEDAEITHKLGLLHFTEAAGAAYAVKPPEPVAVNKLGAATAAACAVGDGRDKETVNAKLNSKEWETRQGEFAHLPKLPFGWLRVRSSSGDIYFLHKKTMETSFEFPLPPGWVKQTSKSTGKVYYFHAATKQSQYDRPTA